MKRGEHIDQTQHDRNEDDQEDSQNKWHSFQFMTWSVQATILLAAGKSNLHLGPSFVILLVGVSDTLRDLSLVLVGECLFAANKLQSCHHAIAFICKTTNGKVTATVDVT